MPELEIRVVDSVADPGIPTLQRVLDPVTMAEHLRRVLPDRCGSARQIRIHILKRHRTRCTFEIEWTSEAALAAMVGKVYAADRVDVYRAMNAIRAAGFGPEDAFSIPEPLAYLPDQRLLLQEKVSGPRVKHVFLTGAEPDRVEAAERCAGWLTRFQASAPRCGQPYVVEDVLESLDEWLQSLDAAGDELAGKAKRLRKKIEAAAAELEPTESRPGHAHYTSGQILLAELRTPSGDSSSTTGSNGVPVQRQDRTAVFDWDGYDVADPSRDVACFVVDLNRLARKTPAASATLRQAADVFLKTCRAHAGENVVVNLPFYAAALYLRLAGRDMGKHGPEKASATLDDGLRLLDRGQWSWHEHA